MNSMIWPSKLLGCFVYEVMVGRGMLHHFSIKTDRWLTQTVGYKITMIAVAFMQCIALGSEYQATIVPSDKSY